MDSSRMKIAYVITDRNGRRFWNRIGVAFVNSDGSINVKLEAAPISGELHIRDYVPRDEGVGFRGTRQTQPEVDVAISDLA